MVALVQESVEACTPEPKKAPLREDAESSPDPDTPVQQPRFWVRCLSNPAVSVLPFCVFALSHSVLLHQGVSQTANLNHGGPQLHKKPEDKGS